MIRLAVRQFRTQALLALLAVAAVAAIVLATHPHLVHLYDTTVANCAARGDCEITTPAFLRAGQNLHVWLGVLVVLAPALVGLFWGAPLVARELESGTFRLAWTQSVTRTRWLLAKVGVAALVSLATAGLLSLAVTWWSGLRDGVDHDAFHTFDQRDLVPIGHAAFAFALGLTAGVVIRRVMPAIATTLVAFVATRLVFNTWVRPHLLAPHRLTTALTTQRMGFGGVDGGAMTLHPDPPSMPDAWVQSIRIVDAAGRALTPQQVSTACPLLGSGGPPVGQQRAGTSQVPEKAADALRACITKLADTYHEVVTYQPAGRYWPLQWMELGTYVGGTVLLVGLCVWWVRRRLA